jgi:nucleotide-binding universal stress UspA family protein
MNPLRHILATTDFAAASERALDCAAELAARFGARLTVAHVIELVPHGTRLVRVPVPEGLRAAGQKRLDAAVGVSMHNPRR